MHLSTLSHDVTKKVCFGNATTGENGVATLHCPRLLSDTLDIPGTLHAIVLSLSATNPADPSPARDGRATGTGHSKSKARIDPPLL